ncbi:MULTISPECIES: hypothetical protein [Pedobacter]|uniref:Uncharacterized protein n=1 Tax=Pedobacter heparinus (strain ATCC 13125 / DSM 2366 / CIP 104194 / JCM 7457 / NBRC 12017 / NCIMB 9290 / NRRL B-14731 / HIM 762-3) TaxID=485917 RepID=C6XU37_PEDHD|nr:MULTISPECIES: hypothetical protein [Pedobacter]ACU05830.1 hypothetical protein Phep_3639 [Pedobacter heparinus DSM 2366]MBB5440903.1 hypothetical protein [Pedobacter sp. AK017]
MNQTLRIISFSAFAIISTFKIIRYVNRPDGNAEIIDKYFQTEWRNDGRSMEQWVKLALKERHINYSSFFVKTNGSDNNEAVVACTNDDETFQYYKYNYTYKSLEPIEDDGIAKPK